jgi:hypothetical protein
LALQTPKFYLAGSKRAQESEVFRSTDRKNPLFEQALSLTVFARAGIDQLPICALLYFLIGVLNKMPKTSPFGRIFYEKGMAGHAPRGYIMQRKLCAVLILLVIAAGGAFAQNWYDSYAPGIDESTVLINAGVGLGFSSYRMGIPPISASVDFKLPVKLPITIGGTAAFSTWGYSSGSGDYQVDVTYTNIGFGVRGAYHFNFVKNLDTYAGITLGYVIQSADVKYGSAYGSEVKPVYDGISFLLYGANIGARYFFTKNIGAYFELGYSGLQVASIGLSVKF